MATLLLSISESHADLSAAYAQLALHHMAPVYSVEVVTLARAIQGEGAALFGENRDEVATWIAHVAYNRWEKPWWKKIDGVDCTFSARIEQDWHGATDVRVEDLEAWALRIAHQTLDERRNGGYDRAKGALFAMTLVDLEFHEWLEQARQDVVHVIPASDDPLVQFWFLEAWPGPGKDMR
jgi:hypothetical protein